jgi:hypothetical protein
MRRRQLRVQLHSGALELLDGEASGTAVRLGPRVAEDVEPAVPAEDAQEVALDPVAGRGDVSRWWRGQR